MFLRKIILVQVFWFIFQNKIQIVEGDQKALLSIATTPMWEEGITPFPGFLHFTLDTYLVLLSVKQGGTKHHF